MFIKFSFEFFITWKNFLIKISTFKLIGWATQQYITELIIESPHNSDNNTFDVEFCFCSWFHNINDKSFVDNNYFDYYYEFHDYCLSVNLMKKLCENKSCAKTWDIFFRNWVNNSNDWVEWRLKSNTNCEDNYRWRQ